MPDQPCPAVASSISRRISRTVLRRAAGGAQRGGHAFEPPQVSELERQSRCRPSGRAGRCCSTTSTPARLRFAWTGTSRPEAGISRLCAAAVMVLLPPVRSLGSRGDKPALHHGRRHPFGQDGRSPHGKAPRSCFRHCRNDGEQWRARARTALWMRHRPVSRRGSPPIGVTAALCARLAGRRAAHDNRRGRDGGGDLLPLSVPALYSGTKRSRADLAIPAGQVLCSGNSVSSGSDRRWKAFAKRLICTI